MNRFALARTLTLIAGFALPLAPLAAQDGARDDAAPQEGREVVVQPAPPPTEQGLPVPEGPVLERKELEGGLIIEEIRIGDGYEVKAGGAVVAHYHGTLKADGAVFDSSFKRGEPVPFSLGGVIEGWQKGVPGMRVGGVRRLTIPANMAYGEQARPTIPANSDLVFVVQLVDALQIEEIEAGEGEAARTPFVGVTVHTIKDSEGNVIEKVGRDNPFLWIPEEFPGMQFGLEGMKVGGKRRLKVPALMNQAPHPAFPTERPVNVPIEIEVELIAKRNLPRG